MEESTIKLIQSYLHDVPLVVLGSGASIPFGLPSMGDLASHLQFHLDSDFTSNQSWIDFKTSLVNGVDLETAMNEATLDSGVHNAIIKSTWAYINKADLDVYHDYVYTSKKTSSQHSFKQIVGATS